MSERRRFPRHRVESLVYVNLGQGNGGILLDISEGGLRVQGAHPLMGDPLAPLQFNLPQSLHPFEASGEIVWTDDSGKVGGVRFADSAEGPNEQINEQIKEWLSFGAPSGHSQADTALQLRSSVPAAVADADAGEVAAEIVGASSTSLESSPHIETHDWLPQWLRSGLSRFHKTRDVRLNQQATSVLAASKRQRGPRWAFAVLFGCLAVLVIVAGMAIFSSRTGGAAALLGNIKKIVARDAGSRQPGQQSATVADKTFQVEVVETDNQRWLLAFRNNAGGRTEKLRRKEVSPRPAQDPQKKNTRPADDSLQPSGVRERTLTSNGRSVTGSIAPPTGGLSHVEPIVPPVETVALPESVLKPPELPQLPQIEQQTLRRSEGVQQPVVIHQVSPVYPSLAKQHHIGGAVELHGIIGRDGALRELKVIRGHPTLTQAALEAARKWRYKPAMLNGEPVEVQTDITLVFRLPQ